MRSARTSARVHSAKSSLSPGGGISGRSAICRHVRRAHGGDHARRASPRRRSPRERQYTAVPPGPVDRSRFTSVSGRGSRRARYRADAPTAVSPMLLARASSIPKLARFAEPRLDGFRAVVTVQNRRARLRAWRGGGSWRRGSRASGDPQRRLGGRAPHSGSKGQSQDRFANSSRMPALNGRLTTVPTNSSA
jgi:hypothetical protein